MKDLLMAIGLLFALVGSIFTWTVYRQKSVKAEFQAKGVSHQAQVLDKREKYHEKSGNTLFQIDLQFKPGKDGKAVKKTLSVHRDLWNTLAQGGVVDILYLPDNTGDLITRYQLEKKLDQVNYLPWSIIALVGLFFALYSLLFMAHDGADDEDSIIGGDDG